MTMTGIPDPTSPATGESPLLEVAGLEVRFRTVQGIVEAVNDVDFEVRSGEVLALVGESGSGKSVCAMSILGLLPPNAAVSGSVRVRGVDLLGFTQRQRRTRSAKSIGIIFQDPVAALNPVLTVGFQLAESIRLHDPSVSRREAKSRAVEFLSLVGIPEPEIRVGYYAHQFSGGQCQRIMIAMALVGEPEILIADEPTTALDVTVQAEILDLLRSLSTRLGTAILLITHDMGVVADFADRVVVMKSGSVVERGSVEDIFYAPREPYTRALLDAVPTMRGPDSAETISPTTSADIVLSLSDITVEFGGRRGARAFRAIDGVSLAVQAGSFMGLVGESGSGKSTLGRVAVGAIDPLAGTVISAGIDLGTLTRSGLRTHQRNVGMVFQNPTNSLNPRFTIGDSVGEPLKVHHGIRGAALQQRVAELLDSVQLSASFASRYPHELSGGQKQRVSIARAIALNPQILVADEPTSALDVSVQAKVLELLLEIQRELRFACLFISHDLAVIDQICDRVAVMKGGVIVEEGTVGAVLRHPTKDYTKRLIAASPIPDPRLQRAREGRGVAPL